jgi:hypothetical protein
VTLTDIVDPSLSFVSAAGSGWTCNSSNNPTITCAETGGPGGAPAVLRPGRSYPPVTVTVAVPLGTGFGSQDSNNGLHVTNAALVTGGAPAQPSASLASPTPIVGVPSLTADNAIDGAIRQGDTGDRYEITVMNVGGAPTDGSAASPITATITELPTGVTVRALYGSGWRCNLGAISTPRAEPADTCYRSDVLAGENGEDPPITVVVSVANDAPARGTETVTVNGGGNVGGPASVSAPTEIAQAADLNAASSHSGNFTQGAKADRYTLTVSNVDGPNAPTTGGPSLGLVSLADTLPWGLTATAISGTGWTCDVAAVTCYRDDALPAGSSYPPVTLTVSVAANAPPSVTNSVTVSGGGMTYGPGSSTSAGGQTGTDRTVITQTGPAGTPPPPPAPPKLTVTSSHAGSFTQGSPADAYTLRVSNGASGGPASGMITVTDTLPAGITPAEMTGAGWTCSLAPPTLPPTSVLFRNFRNPVTNTFEPQPTCFRFGTLPPGASYPPITLEVAVADNAQPSVTNTVAASVNAEGKAGGASGIATGTDPTTVRQLPALAVSSYPSAGGVPFAPFTQGGSGDVYHVTVANDGYAPTSGPVIFTAALPAGVYPVSVSAPPGWRCAVPAATCVTGGGGVSLAAGEQEQILIRVAVAAGAPVSVQALMQASGGGEIPAAGLDTGNDYSTVSNGGEFTDPTYVTPHG